MMRRLSPFWFIFILLIVAVAAFFWWQRDGLASPDSDEVAASEAEVAEWLRDIVVPFEAVEPDGNCDDLRPFMEMVGEARIVSLGEATHGTHEFFTMKHRLLQCLVQHEGFTAFGIEANLPESDRINEYVLHGTGDPVQLLAGLDLWVWNNQELLDLIEWMRVYNQSASQPVVFVGFDMQFARVAMDAVVAGVQAVDRAAAVQVEQGYGCLRPFEHYGGWAEYAKLSETEHQTCRASLQTVYDLIAANEAIYGARTLRYAGVVLQANDLWYAPADDVRDRYMAENVTWQLEQLGSEAKIVLWGHNLHVNDKPGWLGGFLREEYGDEMVVVGFAMHSGTFTARTHAPDEAEHNVVKAHSLAYVDEHSFEHVFQLVGFPRFYVDFRAIEPDRNEAKWLLSQQLFHSRVGAAYGAVFHDPKLETISERYDVMIFMAETTASQLLP
jgi:erythromycin esterase